MEQTLFRNPFVMCDNDGHIKKPLALSPTAFAFMRQQQLCHYWRATLKIEFIDQFAPPFLPHRRLAHCGLNLLQSCHWTRIKPLLQVECRRRREVTAARRR